MKRALLVTTVSGFVPQFEMNNVRLLQGLGYEVHYAANYHNPSYGNDNSRLLGTKIIQHQIDFARSPFALFQNIKVYKQLKKLMLDIKFDLVHCHTPMGGVMARLVAKRTQTRPVIYTAHGFHFYKGAPIVNWLVYYPAERFLSRYTDTLITINNEDYNSARKLHAKKVIHIPGVGIDTGRIMNVTADKSAIMKALGIKENKLIILSAGELIKRKNYETALEAFAAAKLKDAVYLICGHGVLEQRLKDKAGELGISDKVIFAGYRKDIYEIMKCADMFFFPSFQEGLPAALMEAMAAGLPVVCSDIRGNKDLIINNEGGLMNRPTDKAGFSKALNRLAQDQDMRTRMGLHNSKAIQSYDAGNVTEIMSKMYGKLTVKNR